ncbi:MAG: sarcosine oxidase subunit gamma family protein [Pseudomonadota bacterium]
MSEHQQSALMGAERRGDVTVREAGLQGMITLRGDLSDQGIRDAVAGVTLMAVPEMRGVTGDLGGGMAWMSPDEAMIFCAHDRAEALAQELSARLQGQHHLALNVSDARAAFSAEGACVRGVMAKLSPVDWYAGGFGAGEMRRTRLGQVAAAVWMPAEGAVRVICFRSVAAYTFELLSNAAASEKSNFFAS